MRRFYSIDGLLGTTYYDEDGDEIGYSTPGIFADRDYCFYDYDGDDGMQPLPTSFDLRQRTLEYMEKRFGAETKKYDPFADIE